MHSYRAQPSNPAANTARFESSASRGHDEQWTNSEQARLPLAGERVLSSRGRKGDTQKRTREDAWYTETLDEEGAHESLPSSPVVTRSARLPQPLDDGSLYTRLKQHQHTPHQSWSKQ